MFNFPIECGEGWRSLIEETDKKLFYIYPDYQPLQIKEKFGGLRYYISHDGATEMQANIMSDIIYAAEARSSYVCEECGKRGSLRKGGWVRTLCARHAIEQGYEIEDWEKTTYGNK